MNNQSSLFNLHHTHTPSFQFCLRLVHCPTCALKQLRGNKQKVFQNLGPHHAQKKKADQPQWSESLGDYMILGSHIETADVNSTAVPSSSFCQAGSLTGLQRMEKRCNGTHHKSIIIQTKRHISAGLRESEVSIPHRLMLHARVNVWILTHLCGRQVLEVDTDLSDGSWCHINP